MRRWVMRGLVLSLIAGLMLLSVPCGEGEAATIAYYRFEDADDLSIDEQGHTSFEGPSSYTPGSKAVGDIGPGFWDAIAITGATNQRAGDFDGNDYVFANDHNDWTQPSGFTIEALISPYWVNCSDDNAIVAHWGETSYSWMFGVDPGRHPFLKLYDGAAKTATYTDFTIEDGVSYALAAAFDGTEVTLFAKEYGQESYSSYSTTALAVGALQNADAYFHIAAQSHSGSFVPLYPFDGVVDEVRLSTGALGEGELLTSPEPASAGLALLAAGVGALVARRRRKKTAQSKSA